MINMSHVGSGVLLALALGISADLLNGQTRCPRCPDAKPSDVLAPQFVIRGSSVTMPIGAFLLIRKNGTIGAIRLTDVDPSATENLGKSAYESYLPVGLAAGSPGVTRETGEVEVKPEGGMMRGFAYQPGPHRARVGKWSFSFIGPRTLHLSSYHHSGDQGYEFAATSACNYSDVDAQDKRLKWFRYNLNSNVVLPVADLPK